MAARWENDPLSTIFFSSTLFCIITSSQNRGKSCQEKSSCKFVKLVLLQLMKNHCNRSFNLLHEATHIILTPLTCADEDSSPSCLVLPMVRTPRTVDWILLSTGWTWGWEQRQKTARGRTDPGIVWVLHSWQPEHFAHPAT